MHPSMKAGPVELLRKRVRIVGALAVGVFVMGAGQALGVQAQPPIASETTIDMLDRPVDWRCDRIAPEYRRFIGDGNPPAAYLGCGLAGSCSPMTMF